MASATARWIAWSRAWVPEPFTDAWPVAVMPGMDTPPQQNPMGPQVTRVATPSRAGHATDAVAPLWPLAASTVAAWAATVWTAPEPTDRPAWAPGIEANTPTTSPTAATMPSAIIIVKAVDTKGCQVHVSISNIENVNRVGRIVEHHKEMLCIRIVG